MRPQTLTHLERQKKNIRADYLAAAPDLADFYQYDILRPDFAQIIQDKVQTPTDRQALYEALSEQYDGIPISEATRTNLERLKEPTTFTLTTGHQLVLFGGPLYTMYKVLTVIKLAERLNESLEGQQLVPVFWIHTEDHDFEEINHYYTSFTQKRVYEAPFQGKVGSHQLTEAIEALIPDGMPDSLSAAYQAGRDMREAYFRFMNELFGAYGLVILDADHPKLKAQFRSVLRAEIEQQSAYQQVTATSRAMQARGYPLQITPREINLFYVGQGLRNRLLRQGDTYTVLDSSLSFSRTELLELVEQHPEQFSPNVALRPLYQEMILPNLMYTGGWGELSYWLQLRGVFEHHGVNFPLLLPRMSATVFSAETLHAWHGLGFQAADIHRPLHELYKQYMPQVWDNQDWLAKRANLLQGYDELATHLEGFSNTLVRSARGQQMKAERFLQNLEKKIHRVMRHKYPEPFKHIERIKYQVQADPLVQERTWSLAALPMAPHAFVELAHAHCQPLNFEHVYLVLE